MPYLELKNKKFNIELSFKDKYYLVSGYSGQGKSEFVETIQDELNNRLNLKTDLEIFVVDSASTINTVDRICDNKNILVIADEMYAGKLLQKVKGKSCYCLFITRKVYSNINMSYRSLLYVNRNGKGVTTFEQKYKFKTDISDNLKYDIIIVEDSGYGKTFVESITQKKLLVQVGKVI